MKHLGYCGLFAMALGLFLASCANPATSTSASSSSSGTAAYTKLDVTDSSAWAAAVSAGNVRQGTILIKTGSDFDTSSLSSVGATQSGSISFLGGTWRHLSVTTGTEASTILALRKTKGVLVAEPEMVLKLPASETRTRPTGLSSSLLSTKSLSTKSLVSGSSVSKYYTDVFGSDPDPYLASAEYSLEITNAYHAYDSYNPSNFTNYVYAAQLDTGVNFTHEDFYDTSSNFIVPWSKSAFTRTSSTSYTYVGDYAAFHSLSSSELAENWDDDGHGTHTAGIMAAVGNNGKGLAGVMWSHLRLIPYKVITDYESDNESGSGSDWAVYGALLDLATWWSSSKPGDTSQTTLPVNVSLGGYYADEFEIEAIDYALSKNVVIVAAMGNDGRETAEYPAAYTGVIAVGATDGTDKVASFSTRGSWMAVSAPGVNIISTYNGSSSDYEYDSGTSMAAPFVTGLCAFALSQGSSLTPAGLKGLLMGEAVSVSSSSITSVSSSYGAGIVDVYNTVANASSSGYSSDFCSYPIIITVKVNSTLTADVPIYLYNSSGAFVEMGYTGDGTSYTADGTTTSALASTGTVSFYLLTAGSYTATAIYNGKSISNSVTASSTSSGTASIAF